MKVVIVTAFASFELAVQAIQSGACNFLPKPFTAEQLRVIVGEAARQRRMEQRLAEAASVDQPVDFASQDPAMTSAVELARQAAATDATVLICGETGTGKGELAKAIHRWSPRAQRPFALSLARRFRPSCSRARCLATRKARSPTPFATTPAAVAASDSGTLFLARLETCRWRSAQAAACETRDTSASATHVMRRPTSDHRRTNVRLARGRAAGPISRGLSPAVGRGDAAGVVANGVGERAFLVAKHLALEQLGRKRRARDNAEWPLGARLQRWNCLGQFALARASLATDEDCGIGGRRLSRQLDGEVSPDPDWQNPPVDRRSLPRRVVAPCARLPCRLADDQRAAVRP